MNVKPLAAIATKYVARAQAAQGDYQSGIAATPPGVWESATVAAADSFAQGVTMAVAQGRFAAGVAGSGAKWSRKAQALGPTRYAAGVAQAAPDFTAGFTKYHAVLSGLTLGPRGARGDPRNYMRSTAVGQALNQARVSG